MSGVLQSFGLFLVATLAVIGGLLAVGPKAGGHGDDHGHGHGGHH